MLGKPRILSHFLNSFNNFKNMSTHVRSSMYSHLATITKNTCIDKEKRLLSIFYVVSLLKFILVYSVFIL